MPSHGSPDQPQMLMFFPAGFRVLVVDDERDAADSLTAILQLHGADARACYDGPAALALADAFAPDAAVVDLNMPAMDGCAVAGRLRERFAERPPLLVALTGRCDDAARRRTDGAGFELHLVKCGDLSDLERLLARLASRALSRPAGVDATGCEPVTRANRADEGDLTAPTARE
jgi:CheY-like chemotaxis protein